MALCKNSGCKILSRGLRCDYMCHSCYTEANRPQGWYGKLVNRGAKRFVDLHKHHFDHLPDWARDYLLTKLILGHATDQAARAAMQDAGLLFQLRDSGFQETQARDQRAKLLILVVAYSNDKDGIVLPPTTVEQAALYQRLLAVINTPGFIPDDFTQSAIDPAASVEAHELVRVCKSVARSGQKRCDDINANSVAWMAMNHRASQASSALIKRRHQCHPNNLPATPGRILSLPALPMEIYELSVLSVTALKREYVDPAMENAVVHLVTLSGETEDFCRAYLERIHQNHMDHASYCPSSLVNPARLLAESNLMISADQQHLVITLCYFNTDSWFQAFGDFANENPTGHPDVGWSLVKIATPDVQPVPRKIWINAVAQHSNCSTLEPDTAAAKVYEVYLYLYLYSIFYKYLAIHCAIVCCISSVVIANASKWM